MRAGEREKKREILGLPPFGAPPFGAPPFGEPPFSGPPPFRPPEDPPSPRRQPRRQPRRLFFPSVHTSNEGTHSEKPNLTHHLVHRRDLSPGAGTGRRSSKDAENARTAEHASRALHLLMQACWDPASQQRHVRSFRRRASSSAGPVMVRELLPADCRKRGTTQGGEKTLPKKK